LAGLSEGARKRVLPTPWYSPSGSPPLEPQKLHSQPLCAVASLRQKTGTDKGKASPCRLGAKPLSSKAERLACHVFCCLHTPPLWGFVTASTLRVSSWVRPRLASQATATRFAGCCATPCQPLLGMACHATGRKRLS
jgi:hypothetical protein